MTDRAAGRSAETDPGDHEPLLEPHFRELAALARTSAAELSEDAERYARWVRETLREGGKLLFAGNGGSAAHAEHMAAEYRVRFRRTRRPLAALSLAGESASVTAGANDFGYEEVFARAVEALGRPGDLLILHSTSGESPNVIRAADVAADRGIRTVGLTGRGGGELGRRVDLLLAVPSAEVARIQEMHLAIEHAVADRVDRWFAGEGSGGEDDRHGDDDRRDHDDRHDDTGEGAI